MNKQKPTSNDPFISFNGHGPAGEAGDRLGAGGIDPKIPILTGFGALRSLPSGDGRREQRGVYPGMFFPGWKRCWSCRVSAEKVDEP